MSSEPDPKLAMVVAVARNGAIGMAGTLPWRLSSDLKMFRKLTMGKPLIMGRRTFQSLPGALDGRDNLVVSRAPGLLFEGAEVFATTDAALERARVLARQRGVDEVMLIGGAALYDTLLDQVDRVYWTHVDAEPEADTFLAALAEADWVCKSTEALMQGARDDYASELRVYERKSAVPNT
ncbi:MAG: dihydrofolate reductase [Pseudomonadota bacterium]